MELLAVFLVFAAQELLLTLWTKTTVKGRALSAALLAGVIRAISFVGLYLVIQSPVLALAAIAGDMTGSWVGVTYGNRKEPVNGEDRRNEGSGEENPRRPR